VFKFFKIVSLTGVYVLILLQLTHYLLYNSRNNLLYALITTM